MRTLKTLAAFAALLLVAGSANAAPILTLTVGAFDGDPDVEIEVTLSYTAGDTEGVGVLAYSLDFGGVGILAEEFNNAAPLDCTTSGAAPVAATGEGYFCANNTFAGGLIGRQTIAAGTWDGNATIPHSAADLLSERAYCSDAFDVLCDGPAGVDSGDFFVNDIVVPEPTTAALLGLGLVGLAASGRRRS